MNIDTQNPSLRPSWGPMKWFTWPLHSEEGRTFTSMAILTFLMVLTCGIMRPAKDILMLMGEGAPGVLTLPYLKNEIVPLVGILSGLVYIKLSNVWSREQIFFRFTLALVGFWAFFCVAVLPNTSFFYPHPDSVASKVQQLRAAGATGPLISLVQMAGSWGHTLFYILVELWSAWGIGFLFWELATHITLASQAKRFYPLWGIAGLLASLCASLCLRGLAHSSANGAGSGLGLVLFLGILSGVASLAVLKWVGKNILRPLDVRRATHNPSDVQQPKAGIFATMKLLVSSPYLLLLGSVIIFSNIASHLIDLLDRPGLMRGDVIGHSTCIALMNQKVMVSNLTSLGAAFLLAPFVTKFGWRRSALAMPLIVFAGGALVGTCAFLRENHVALAPIAQWIGPFAQGIVIGATASIFQTTREMAYIPLDAASRTKGRALVMLVALFLSNKIFGWIFPFILQGSSCIWKSVIVFGVLAACWMAVAMKLSGLYEKKKLQSSF